jgi:hypothetical protein
MLRIGMTDTGDAGLQLEWISKMDHVQGAILLTRVLTPEFLEALAPFRNRVLVHVLCTGYGGTVLEPNIPAVVWTRGRYTTLVDALAASQTVLRLDPIIPTARGLAVAESVLEAFDKSPVQRVRYRCLPMLPSVVARFQSANLSDPYDGAAGPRPGQLLALGDLLARWEQRFQFESCAEPDGRALGCLSSKDAGPLGFDPAALADAAPVRPFCRCPANRLELLGRADTCGQGCLYCVAVPKNGRAATVPSPPPTPTEPLPVGPGSVIPAAPTATDGEPASETPYPRQLTLLG